MTNQETPMSVTAFSSAIFDCIEWYGGEFGCIDEDRLKKLMDKHGHQLTAAKDAEIAALHEVINMKDRLREELQAQLAETRKLLMDCRIYIAAAAINSDGRNPVQKVCRRLNEALAEPTQAENPCE